MHKINRIHFSLIFLIIFFFSCNAKKIGFRNRIDLSGEWQFQMDSAGVGIEQKWYLNELNDKINLPGSMDENKKGFLNTDTTTQRLNRVYNYEGPAWYRKKITIPENFANQHIELSLERTRSSQIWIDDKYIGKSKLLQSPQNFDVTEFITPGEHTLTICIDNTLSLTPYGYIHIYSDDTQTNWNGILGDIYLEASAKTYISNLQITPNIAEKSIDIELGIENQLQWENVDIELLVEKTEAGKTTTLPRNKISSPLKSEMTLIYDLGDNCSLWDEYHQPLYRLTAIISNGKIKDSKSAPFGMREFTASGTQFQINGRTTFLRGKHEAAVFPETGYPPMDVAGWERVYKIAKSYGINHYRFHSYTPAEAAMTAADNVGIYLQIELPFWGGQDSISVALAQREEGFAMLKAYANHPSVVMFSPGNEIWSGHDNVEQNIIALEKFDSRPLYSLGCNNNSGYTPPSDCSEFFVTSRTPYEKDSILTHTRLTHCYVDAKDGGILNTQPPSTDIRFDYPVAHVDIPIVGHEIGQYQIYPDYAEIDKYTGIFRAWNLETFRHRLEKAGMLDQNMAFQKASGAWSALCYKAEMEAAIGTKGFAGFQLLDLQDFPGQGTALVGILDAFMDSKNVITREAWRQSCDDVVILLEFPKYVWTTDENFSAKINVANYSNHRIDEELKWRITSEKSELFNAGTAGNSTINNEGITTISELNIDLSSITKSQKLIIDLSLGEYSNSYSIWVYPAKNGVQKPDNIMISEKLDKQTITSLKNGGNVLLFPATEDVKDKSFEGHFPPEFWNYGMFKGISEWAKKPISPGTLGLLMESTHPLFNSFPTDFHTNWQWFSIIKASNSLILDETAKEYQPIVQVIDNLERNHKLGLIFEFKVGDGKLLVCMSQLQQILDKPEAKQLYASILEYMESDEFDPDYEVNEGLLRDLLGK